MNEENLNEIANQLEDDFNKIKSPKKEEEKLQLAKIRSLLEMISEMQNKLYKSQ